MPALLEEHALASSKGTSHLTERGHTLGKQVVSPSVKHICSLRALSVPGRDLRETRAKTPFGLQVDESLSPGQEGNKMC